MESVYLNYAAALYSLLRDDKDKLTEYQKALREIMLDFEKEPDFLRLLCSRSLPMDAQERLIDSVYGDRGLDYLPNFLKLLVKKRRMNHFDDVVRAYSSLVNEDIGVSEGVVYTLNKLSKEELASLEKAISLKVGQKAELRNVVDNSILGGVKVSIEGKVYDATLKSKLDSLKGHLKKN